MLFSYKSTPRGALVCLLTIHRDYAKMKYIILLCSLSLSITVVAQKRLSQTYDAVEIQELYINSNEIFQIHILVIDSDQVTVHTVIDGELFSSTLLHTVIENKVLKITTGSTPDYTPFNDKLAAHKVLAITIKVTVPIGTDLSIYSTLANVEARGQFGQVRVDLGRGRFVGEAFRFRESANINTLYGSITLGTAQANLSAQSRYGTLVLPAQMTTGPLLHLQSIDGDISVVKSL